MRLKSFNLLKAASMRQRSLYRRLLKLNGCFLLERFGMTDLVPCSSSSLRNSALSYALSPSMRLGRCTLRNKRSATGQSCASPPVNRMAISRPLASASAWIFVLRPPRERPTACFFSPLFRPGESHVDLRLVLRQLAIWILKRTPESRGGFDAEIRQDFQRFAGSTRAEY